jgi:hypothetical protein
MLKREKLASDRCRATRQFFDHGRVGSSCRGEEAGEAESRVSATAQFRAVCQRFRRSSSDVMDRLGQALSAGFRVARRARLRAVMTGVPLGWALAPWAHAADSPSRIPAADVAAAQASFERGRALMAQGRAEEACPLFEESQRLDAGLGTQFNLARCYEAVGRFASAYTLFVEVAATAQERGQLQRAKVAAEHASGVEPKLSRLIIEVAPQQHAVLTLERDGNLVASPEWALAFPVDPGVHEVRAGGALVVPWVHQVLVGTNPEIYTVRVPVLPFADGRSAACDPTANDGCDPTPLGSERPVTTTQEAIGLVALGVGVAGLGVGVGFAIHAYSKNESSEDAGCDDRGCPDQASLSLRRQAVSAGNWATLGAGVGLAGVGAAALLFWVFPDPDATANRTARLQPRLARDVAGLDVYGRF